ncbi:MAG TPA: hypothetical protein VNB06_13465, partial [Thermoanaerobaculia bacterium]|nr:hypothetical protein [Thermoanaerobaculia bacterium]
ELIEIARIAARGELVRPSVPKDVFAPRGYYVERMRVERGLEPGLREPMDPLPDGVDATSLCLVSRVAPTTVERDTRFRVELALTNGSDHALASTGPHPVHLAYRWLDDTGAPLTVEPRRSLLPRAVAPGAVASCLAEVDAPAEAGRYRLQLLLVQEMVRWLDQPAEALPEVEIEVLPQQS